MLDSFLTDAVAYLPLLLQGALTTIYITVAALAIATLLGLCWALLRVSGIAPLAHASRVLTNVIRGVPIIVVLFYMYFVIPEIGISLTAFQAGSLGLGIAYSSYMAEVFRAGINAVDVGQFEAAQSLGMSRTKLMRRVILPQALRIALPPYGNNVVMMLKDSSQTAVITVVELSMQSKLIASATFKSATVFTLVALMYLAMSLPMMYSLGRLEKRMGSSK
ncbi:amino acid ABC transporter permease [Burkholderia sp. FERM BP-3421]|jgi:polar amino acid transport system permease protein|uniref:amino acid ABC transporter permease n=1 Tax=Burkholderia sp. FERM BP-3421 TaxID=1494466 RepID=UPI002361F2AF|nr:amino acid ABC transporter permease [Burkholderia sp. FERM BP-3421]WDD93232.1 amino acid ABC transporter permease [Burkholderia sp. FERM BP-3421]